MFIPSKTKQTAITNYNEIIFNKIWNKWWISSKLNGCIRGDSSTKYYSYLSLYKVNKTRIRVTDQLKYL